MIPGRTPGHCNTNYRARPTYRSPDVLLKFISFITVRTVYPFHGCIVEFQDRAWLTAGPQRENAFTLRSSELRPGFRPTVAQRWKNIKTYAKVFSSPTCMCINAGRRLTDGGYLRWMWTKCQRSHDETKNSFLPRGQVGITAQAQDTLRRNMYPRQKPP